MLKILRKCRLNQYLSNDTKHDPTFFSLDSTFNEEEKNLLGYFEDMKFLVFKATLIQQS